MVNCFLISPTETILHSDRMTFLYLISKIFVYDLSHTSVAPNFYEHVEQLNSWLLMTVMHRSKINVPGHIDLNTRFNVGCACSRYRLEQKSLTVYDPVDLDDCTS